VGKKQIAPLLAPLEKSPGAPLEKILPTTMFMSSIKCFDLLPQVRIQQGAVPVCLTKRNFFPLT